MLATLLFAAGLLSGASEGVAAADSAAIGTTGPLALGFALGNVPKTLTASTGSFVFTGSGSGLLGGRVLPAGTGAFAFTGQPATLSFVPTVGAQLATTFPLALGLNLGSSSGPAILSAGTGAFAFTFAGSESEHGFSAAPGSFAWAGNPASLRVPGRLTGATGVFAFTGRPATLTFAPSGRLAAATASFAFTGNPANLYAPRRLTAQAAAFALTGRPAVMFVGKQLVAGAGSFSLNGGAATLRVARVLRAAVASFRVTTTQNISYSPNPNRARVDFSNSAGAIGESKYTARVR